MESKEKLNYPLVDSSYDNSEIINCIETLLSGQLTMGEKVREFETIFSQYIGSPYSIMVNSGSSANLLACSAIVNPLRKKHLKYGDKVAIPSICWSTSLWPIVQMGLIPVLIDIDPDTLNLSISSLKSAIQEHNIKAIMMVHVLGNSTEVVELLEIVNNNKLILIEDTCESLGTKFQDSYLGTLGEFGTYSFYFSHHMTTIEGGMIVAKSQEDCDILKCLRAHGWSREHSNRKKLESTYSNIDPRFLFINLGYNVRPMEIQAAFGLVQINRLEEMNDNRRKNVNEIRRTLTDHPLWNGQFKFPVVTKDLNPCWFGFTFLLDDKLKINYKQFVKKLLERGIDTRPMISGNMALQPAVKHFDVDLSMGPFNGAQAVHERGIFIGCHSKELDKKRIY
ncbi:MAG TPA: DegT/DnrJ/EryC1/StrS family aminotransferase, partial [candidate division Zixibacteria bacterium]|nr:DegT/DnrJ/EryC1/StrS family aminotransferase [candidate division Zixibacteria bacterium]